MPRVSSPNILRMVSTSFYLHHTLDAPVVAHERGLATTVATFHTHTHARADSTARPSYRHGGGADAGATEMSLGTQR
jgi:hypothetical protein